ncbi:MAG: endopeptidase La [Muribaculaceae bacterium]|nr:endopeptidase La [Muribaculaceae bacterium]
MQEMQISGSFIAQLPGDDEFDKVEFNEGNVTIFPLAEDVVFPGLPLPIKLTTPAMEEIADLALQSKETVLSIVAKEDVEFPSKVKDFYPVGILSKVVKVIRMPGTMPVAFLLPGPRAKLRRIVKKTPLLQGSVTTLPPLRIYSDQETEILQHEIEEVYSHMLSYAPDEEAQRLNMSLTELGPHPDRHIYFMAMHSPLSAGERASLLVDDDFKRMLERFLKLMDMSLQKLELQANIQMRTHEDISRKQREEFLKHQMRAIQNELSDEADSSDIAELRERADKKPFPKEAKIHFDKELKKLERLNSQNPEYSVQYSYLDTLLNLPWKKYSPDDFALSKVEKILDRDHYGLESVKERIIEQMAVIKLRKDMKAPIICLYGPPGVGKTSLGKSIADALGREYARVSLGGLHDEAEIRGHRRTYIGAMPGRIIAALEKCGTSNPVFVLDEIDKIGKDFKGDPSTALLEVLDPEQNSKFHDNYIDFDYDLSKIMFIATANSLSEISGPLLDRMEIIEIGGYIPDEKVEIAQRHLVPKSLLEHGFEKNEILFSKPALHYIVERYTRESGVRQLEKKIAKVLRKIARLKASDKEFPTKLTVDNIKTFLGKEEVNPDSYETNKFAGVVTGLAWTQVGGEILFIESSLSPGNGDKLTLTGNLGDVMKESAVIALQYLKAHSKRLGIKPELFNKCNVHIHVPEGAIPKDGPSAGVTMATSLASAFLGRKVRDKIAMTGEITLRGKVLPVGGIKEKILAAKRAGITDIILSDDNRKDIEEINKKYLSGLTFHFVETVEDVLNFALLNEDAENKFDLE